MVQDETSGMGLKGRSLSDVDLTLSQASWCMASWRNSLTAINSQDGTPREQGATAYRAEQC